MANKMDMDGRGRPASVQTPPVRPGILSLRPQHGLQIPALFRQPLSPTFLAAGWHLCLYDRGHRDFPRVILQADGHSTILARPAGTVAGDTDINMVQQAPIRHDDQ